MAAGLVAVPSDGGGDDTHQRHRDVRHGVGYGKTNDFPVHVHSERKDTNFPGGGDLFSRDFLAKVFERGT